MLGHWKKLCPWYFSLAQETTHMALADKTYSSLQGNYIVPVSYLGDSSFSEFSFDMHHFWTLMKMSHVLEDFFYNLQFESYVELMNKDSGEKIGFLNIHRGLNLWKEMTLRNDILFSKGNNQKGECQWWQVQGRNINQRHQCLCPWSQTNKYQVRTKEREILTSNFTYNWRECKWMSNCYIKRKESLELGD